MKYYSVKFIDASVREYTQKLLIEYCQKKNYKIFEISVTNEYVELSFNYPQSISVTDIIKGMKNSTSRQIRGIYPKTLGTQKSFWINSRAEFRRGYVFVSLSAQEKTP